MRVVYAHGLCPASRTRFFRPTEHCRILQPFSTHSPTSSSPSITSSSPSIAFAHPNVKCLSHHSIEVTHQTPHPRVYVHLGCSTNVVRPYRLTPLVDVPPRLTLFIWPYVFRIGWRNSCTRRARLSKFISSDHSVPRSLSSSDRSWLHSRASVPSNEIPMRLQRVRLALDVHVGTEGYVYAPADFLASQPRLRARATDHWGTCEKSFPVSTSFSRRSSDSHHRSHQPQLDNGHGLLQTTQHHAGPASSRNALSCVVSTTPVPTSRSCCAFSRCLRGPSPPSRKDSEFRRGTAKRRQRRVRAIRLDRRGSTLASRRCERRGSQSTWSNIMYHNTRKYISYSILFVHSYRIIIIVTSSPKIPKTNHPPLCFTDTQPHPTTPTHSTPG